jgi:anthranilate phosphoribosyltransferase
MFAPAHHRATRFVVPVRKALGVRTIFNLLGPLTNPAGAGCQLIGVSDRSFTEVIAGALRVLGSARALVVSSDDGLDELSAGAPTRVIEVDGEEIRRYTVTPVELGVEAVASDAVPAGTPDENAATTRAVLAGRAGPSRAVALMNAGAAIYAAGRAETIAEGVEMARRAIDDGAAGAALERFVAASRRLAPTAA